MREEMAASLKDVVVERRAIIAASYPQQNTQDCGATSC